MIDETLARLSRDLITASDKLASEDFLKRQARFVEIEAERAALAEGLESDEAAVVRAQAALQAYILAWSVDEQQPDDPAAEDMTIQSPSGREFVFPVADEFSSSRANGPYAED